MRTATTIEASAGREAVEFAVSVPVYLASPSPKMLELTGEVADGWLATTLIGTEEMVRAR